jgi:hypothetical protein
MDHEEDMKVQEVEQTKPEPEAPQDCRFCAFARQSPSDEAPPAASSMHFMTEREMKALTAMRRIKEESSGVKNRMRQMEAELGYGPFQGEQNGKGSYETRGKTWMQGMSEDWMELARRLDHLREEWKKMDQEREDAAEERMRLLGHVQ